MFKVFVIRLLMRVFRVFPVNRKKIFFSSFEGKSITCNPKYIFDELQKRHGNKLVYVWELNGSCEKEFKTVKHNSLSYMFHIMTAKILITNTGISAVFPLRKKQIVINTWHGSGAYKKVGKDISQKINGTSEYRTNLSNKSLTHFISGCGKFTEVMSNALGLDKSKFLPIGMPRNDCLVKGVGAEDIKRIKSKIGVSEHVKIVLYAPTFRGATSQAQENTVTFEVNNVIKALKERFGGDWIFAYRGHYLVKSEFANNVNCIDLSDYDNTQELLLASEVLISDYSSVIWDYSLTLKPCFLFCNDLSQYKDERDFYVPITEWGFPIATDEAELYSRVAEFDNNDYVAKMEKHHNDLVSYETGVATEKVCGIVEQHLNL